ncbi:MAG: type II toxin-antitoxin system VapC family toxin, partial [Candidatus Saccharimonadales bacterium]
YDTVYLLEGIKASGFLLLDIYTEHLQAYASVRLPHKDPFDSLLVAQSEVENCIFLTADANILGSNYTTHDARQ